MGEGQTHDPKHQNEVNSNLLITLAVYSELTEDNIVATQSHKGGALRYLVKEQKAWEAL